VAVLLIHGEALMAELPGRAMILYPAFALERRG